MIGDYHARFDPELYKQYVDIVGKGNVKGDFEEYMRTRVAADSNDIEGINLQILKKEILSLQKKKTKLDAELQSKLNMEERYKELAAEKEKKKLEQEKERLENSRKCIQCGCILTDQTKTHEFNQGSTCSACYHNGTPEMFRKWMEPKSKEVEN